MAPAHTGASAVGIGLRAPHYRDILERRPALAFLEVHSENFFGPGGAALGWLERFRALYPLSLHGVGLSLGSADPLDERHLSRLAALVARFEPRFVSEHLCWSSFGGRHANDLLPLPRTEEALAHVVRRVEAVQARLGRRILLENVSAYTDFPESAIPEGEFLAELARRSGCGILLDVNNLRVNALNLGHDPHAALAALDPARVEEVHLAGYEMIDGIAVDTHGAPVRPEVWALYDAALARLGPVPTLVEWDTRIPPLDVLLAEAARASAALARVPRASGARALA